MPDFSVIVQDPAVRSIVQDQLLTRRFEDGLFPALLFREFDAEEKEWAGKAGDTVIDTGKVNLTPDMVPLQPGVQPGIVKEQYEQWQTTLQQWAKSIEIDMPTSAVAAANLFLEKAQVLGLMAAQSMNRVSRNVMYNAAMSGSTVASAQVNAAATAIPVQRLNGFTTARNPALAAGSQVRYSPVSASNPLAIIAILDDGSIYSGNVTAFVSANGTDEIGPGTLTVDTAIPGGRNIPARNPVLAVDRTSILRAGGFKSITSITNANVMTAALHRSAVTRLRDQNVAKYADGWHAHFDAISENQVFGDSEFKQMHQGLPDYAVYKDFALGKFLGVIVFQNNECPNPNTVKGPSAAAGTTTGYDTADPFGGEMFSNNNASSGVEIHRPLYTGMGGLREYYFDQMDFVSDAGMNGKRAEPAITNNGIFVPAKRIQFVFRAPIDPLQQKVLCSYSFVGAWVERTDAGSGDLARYKRALVVEHGA